MGSLSTAPALSRADLLARPVVDALHAWPVQARTTVDDILVAPIDSELADTAAFCAAYDVPLEASANCVIVAGRRSAEVRYAACVVLATTRADVNSVVRRQLEARKASFAPMETAVAETGMEYGGITPIGLPDSWPVLVDSRVVECRTVVVGSGIRRSKIVMPGRALLDLAGTQLIEGLARAVA